MYKISNLSFYCGYSMGFAYRKNEPTSIAYIELMEHSIFRILNLDFELSCLCTIDEDFYLLVGAQNANAIFVYQKVDNRYEESHLH